MKELLVFVPAYNEQDNIEKVARDLEKNCPGVDYIVIDDGSTDDTARICREKNIPCMSLPVNLGLDGVFQTGNKYAYLSGYQMSIPFDGDGQHNAEYIMPLVDKMKEGYDIVVGSRFLEKKKNSSLRMLGSRLLSGAFRLTTGQKFTDPTSGMRLVDRKIMRQIAFDPNCGAEPDTWAYFVRKGAKLAEVQVEMNERKAGTSYFTLAKSIAYMFRILISMIFINLFRGKER
ncbi:glycosyltransferase family 2 protein [Christensenella timonensis]|uniref:glycosyltransferase family 2 protein n=1 Tax=Christensenella timonensis TaxID=1816678 RepID=UPI00082CE013|nr:glycosyltransferase family 2 protein [Christensenella timonensis]